MLRDTKGFNTFIVVLAQSGQVQTRRKGLEGSWNGMRTSRAARVTSAMVLAMLLLVPNLPLVSTFPYDPYIHSRMNIVDISRDPGEGGEDLSFRVSTDGTSLLLLGYGACDYVSGP